MAVAVEVRVSDVPAKAKELRRQAARLQRRISTAAGRVVESHLRPRIVELAPQHLPSGYTPLFAHDVTVRTSTRFVHNPGVTATVSAPTGGTKGRDVPALERGVLAHPLFGKRSYVDRAGVKKSGWFRQKVKAGLAKTALKSTRHAIIRGLDDELGKIVRELAT